MISALGQVEAKAEEVEVEEGEITDDIKQVIPPCCGAGMVPWARAWGDRDTALACPLPVALHQRWPAEASSHGFL